MTPFLLTLLTALLVAGGLTIVYRDYRPRFRRAVELTLAAGLIVAGYVMWVSGGELQRIDASQITLSDLRMTEVAGSFRLEGRAHNSSTTHRISTLPVRLLVEDCNAAGVCRVVHDETAEVTISIGPGESAVLRRVYVGHAAAPGPAAAGASPVTRRWRVGHGAPRASLAPVR